MSILISSLYLMSDAASSLYELVFAIQLHHAFTNSDMFNSSFSLSFRSLSGIIVNHLFSSLQVSDSNFGREHVVPSIVQLGFLLLEGVEEGSYKEFDKLDGILGPEELGTEVLRSLFEVHDMARNEVGIDIHIYRVPS